MKRLSPYITNPVAFEQLADTVHCHKPLIIASSYSFGPRCGSETGIGWNTVASLAKDHRVLVICEYYYAKLFTGDDLKGLESRGISVLFFKAPWSRLLLAIRPAKFAEWFHYLWWQRKVRKIVEEEVCKSQPALLTHITWGTGRIACPLTNLGVTVLHGPVGGFESGHPLISWSLGLKFGFWEWLRRLFIRKAIASRRLKENYKQIDMVLATTHESKDAMSALGAENIICVPNAGTTEESCHTHAPRRRVEEQNTQKGLRLLFVGRLQGWKGEELAIRALARTNKSNVELTILGKGSNLSLCQRIVGNMGLKQRVRFVSELPQEEVWNYYHGHDVLLYPSLHDSGGNAVIEAMATGMPVICLDLGGPGEYVDATSGIKIKPGSLATTISALTEAIDSLDRDRELLRRLGEGAAARCLSHLTWEAREKAYLTIVRQLVANARRI